jgi:MOSC domain-containing protein YiiM
VRIVDVCVGLPTSVRYRGKATTTGIFKRPVAGHVRAGFFNLEGDGQADLSVHGGRDKAMYAYSQEHYAAWANELGRKELEPSQFGENLTVRGMTEDSVIVGDRYRFGCVYATVTQPRLPCFKLGIRLDDDEFPNRLLASGRLGFYLRVEEEGTLQRGDSIELLERPQHGISVMTLWQSVFGGGSDASTAQYTLDSLPDLDAGWIRRLKRIASA